MKAVICTKYGSPEVLQFVEIKKPIPKDNEVLIKIHYTTVHIGDTKIRRLEPGMGKVKDFFVKPMMRIMLGFLGPRKKVLGMEYSGEIEAIGKDVTKFKKGDKVFGSTELNFGTYAEYTCMPENSVMATIPKDMNFEQSAPLSNGSLTALFYLKKANISKGKKVLIYGASGSVGTFAVQIAKYFQTIVTAVCSTQNIEMVKNIGADFTIDYTTEDFTKNGEKYDIIFDAVGKIIPKKQKISLAENGHYVNVLDSDFKLKIEELNFVIELCEKGELTSVIDRTYSFNNIIEAHKYVDKGHKKGNVVIKIVD